ncbi:F-box/LRR-repeat protein At3g58930-like [Raphanus sativus]|uniref:F-box/LRR-repeat protein At3g58930-like n=1 Tax=Raphanus sativus TaxID=3726 RepID=A0A6J0JXR2_RAPSA|nr:F-box/LRR-repeat protein At3g58930-like [Raphanus sativus]XP_018440488.1 F-box/LRR-repeat protein At3g58930-like [Raphanus sativus]
MDRLTSLPDELLHHILSCLPTKSAVVTSSLSKRWLNLWKHNPNLDIDDSVFIHPEDGKGEREEIRQSFVRFVDGVLAMQGDSPINNFALKCITGVHPDTVNRWICNVLQRGVSDLNLFTDFTDEDTEDDSYHLPKELFFSSTLVKLKLRSEHCVDWWWTGGMWSDPFSLPMLKSLDIDSDLIFCGKIEEFIPAFPVLEELRMGSMEWIQSDVTVSSATLRTLSLHGTGCDDFVNPTRVSFDTPNLNVLSYYDLVAQDYPVVNMKKLVHATINLIVTDEQVKRLRESDNDLAEDDDADDVFVDFGNVAKLMNGIQTVQQLSFTADTLEVLSQCCNTLPVFNNLKFLGITSEEGRGWQAMPALIKNCPRLETIILEGLLHCVTDKCGDACPCISREDKGRSLRSCPVNRLEIQGFRATMKEMNMIKHFLDYFPSLKRLDVVIEDNEPTQLRNPELSNCVKEMFKLYSEMYPSCSVELQVSAFLQKKWRAQGHI